MKTHIALLAAATALAATAHAEKIAFDLKDPKGVNNIVFKLDAPLESISGTANGISGTVVVDPAQPEEIEGKIVVDSKTLTVSNSMMQEHMLSADWIDAETHPQITFEVKEVLNPVKSTDTEGTADVKGVFTLKGISKEITVPAKVTYLENMLGARSNGKMQGDLIVIRTNFQINRGDFGIKAGENLDKVSDTIDISLSIAGSAPKS